MTAHSPSSSSAHTWKFFRIGGLDQVALQTGADLLNLQELDQKLWVALSCPVKGLELDEKTLALIDTDADGRIRVPELLAAIRWAAEHLKDAGLLLQASDTLELAALNDATASGKALLASAKEILASLGKASATSISLADAADTTAVFSKTKFNGDSIIIADSASDDALKLLIADIIATIGSVADRSGQAGVDLARIESFYADAAAFAAWSDKGLSPDVLTLGAATPAAAAAVKAIAAKVDDFFSRTRLAAFDTRALAALDRAEGETFEASAKDLAFTAAELSAFPLAQVSAGKPLPLTEGINPAWAGAVAALSADAVTPLFGARASLTETEWTQLKTKVAAYDAWTAAKAGASVEKLGLPRVKAVLAAATEQKAALVALIAQDAALAEKFATISAVEKLLRYVRDFRTLLNNFVNFTDFYSPDKLATFQAGTLYLDSRSSEFCIRVDAPNPLAAMAKVYIAYVSCTRKGEAPITLAACFTQGDSDFLFVGRHGIFYDRKGRDWDAVITSIVDNPISLRQAFWSPYKKFVRMIDEMVAKRAAAADAAANDKLLAAANTVANADKAAAEKAAAAKADAAPKKVDIGAVAAISVGVGAIGGALAAVATGLAGLTWWQYPLVILGIILAISGPAVIIAWLKLRQRTLGPILDANGWAINGRVKINIPFGTALTDRAVLPTNSTRSLEDPYEDKEAAKARRRTITIVVLIALVAGAWWVRHNQQQNGRYFWQPKPAAPAAPEAPKA